MHGAVDNVAMLNKSPRIMEGGVSRQNLGNAGAKAMLNREVRLPFRVPIAVRRTRKLVIWRHNDHTVELATPEVI